MGSVLGLALGALPLAAQADLTKPGAVMIDTRKVPSTLKYSTCLLGEDMDGRYVKFAIANDGTKTITAHGHISAHFAHRWGGARYNWSTTLHPNSRTVVTTFRVVPNGMTYATDVTCFLESASVGVPQPEPTIHINLGALSGWKKP